MMQDMKTATTASLLIIGCYFAIETNAQENPLTITGCLRGSGCSQCPRDKYTTDTYGEMLCCPGCAKALLYHGESPARWCVCYVEPDSADSRTIKFPSGNTRFRPSSDNEGQAPSSVIFRPNPHRSDPVPSTEEILRDAMVVLRDGNRGEVSLAVHEALTLMATTIEELNARITRLEDIIFHAGIGHVRDRLGTAANSPGTPNAQVQGLVPPPPATSTGESCPGVNFTRVGGTCYHVSAWKDHRAVWQEASKSCENMGAKLAEPVESSNFIALTQYLSLDASTTGFSYWLGGFYPGVSWLWSYAGAKVTLGPSYWTGTDASGNRVSPGDTSPGRCLSFSYLQSSSNYFFAADECGYEKYYVCELIEKTVRRA